MFRRSVIALSLIAIGCGHHSSVSHSSSRCGVSSVTNVTWVGDGWVGAGVGVFAVGAYGIWYSPDDTYDPVTDDGDVNGGAGWYDNDPTYPSSSDVPPPPEDVEIGDDDSNDPGDPGDTGGDDTGSGDVGDPSTESLKPLTLANGCYSCTVGCTTIDGSGQRVGRQATGVSDVSYEDACQSGIQSLGSWAHTTLHRPIDSCQQIEPSQDDAGARVPAAPVVR